MRRLGSFFQRYSSGNSHPSEGISNVSVNETSFDDRYSRISDDNDAKRRAISADGYSAHAHAHQLRSLADGYSRTEFRGSSTVEDSSIEDYVKRVRKTAMYLKLVLHSKSCQGRCRVPSCLHTYRVLKHVLCCRDNLCHATGCQTTKKLLIHYQQCPTKSAAAAAAVQAKESQRHQRERLCCDAQMLSEGEAGSPHGGRHSYSVGGDGAVNSDDSLESIHDSPRSTSSVPHSAFCLLCSFVATGGPDDAAQQIKPEYRTADATGMHGEDSDAVEMDDSDDMVGDGECSSSSLIIFDEVMDFNKVPFQNTHEQFQHHDCARPFPLAPLPEGCGEVEEEPRRKVRSKSLNVVDGMQF